MVLLLARGNAATTEYVTYEGKRVHPTAVMATYRTGVTASEVLPLLRELGLHVVWEAKSMPGLVHLDLNPEAARLPNGDPASLLTQRLDRLRRSGLFESVSPDHIGRLALVPNDGFFQDVGPGDGYFPDIILHQTFRFQEAGNDLIFNDAQYGGLTIGDIAFEGS
ncbi:MAG: hypothetical protein EBY09_19630 [Verrucomicrobia bacterium]|nr:hypothetical protein [Verrucomicrobiota bacterium]